VNTYCNSRIQIIQREIHNDHMNTRFGYKETLEGNWIENIILNYGTRGGTILKGKQKIEWQFKTDCPHCPDKSLNVMILISEQMFSISLYNFSC
jgi:hypothetical protein